MLTEKKRKKANLTNHFLKNNSGGIIIAFAVMVPTIFIFLGSSINYSQTMRTRALISEASNEASLAVVATDNKNEDAEKISVNQKLAQNYINYYLHKTITDDSDNSTINIQYEPIKKEYYLAYNGRFEMVLSSQSFKDAGKDVNISNRLDTYGNTRKTDIPQPVDIIFITDFSGSATCEYSDPDCNNYSQSVSPSNRMSMIKDVITQIVSKHQNDKNFHFSLVPYDIGVPLRNDVVKNPAGGDAYQCSVMYQLKPAFRSVDYNFWANKNVNYMRWNSLKKSGVISDYVTFDYVNRYSNNIFYNLDSSYYTYYSKIVGPSKGYNNDSQLVSGGLCRKVHGFNSPNYGEHMYSCGSERDDYPLSLKNRQKVKEQYGAVVQLYDYMFSDQNYDTHYSFANTLTVDVAGTIASLFSGMANNTITFDRPIAPTLGEFSPFMGMCQSALFGNDLMTDGMGNMTRSKIYKQAANTIGRFQSSPHLIPLTKTVSDNQALISTLNSMSWKPGGGTDTMTALLRSVPVAAEGDGYDKVFIIITDGVDDSGADTLRDDFLDAGVCQAITTGFTSIPNESKKYIEKVANSAEIHYVKIAQKAENITTAAQYQNTYGKWYTQCMAGKTQYLHSATDYKSLLEIINKDILSETGLFIQKK